MKDIFLPGSGQAVLLLHGLRGNPLELLFLAQRLNAAGHTVSVPYLPGYGQRPGDGAFVSRSEDWQAAAGRHLDELSRQYGPVLLGGLCIGATLSLHLAATQPRAIAGLMLISTTLYYDGWNQPAYRWLLPLAGRTPLKHWYREREREPYGVKNPRIREWIARQMERNGNSAAGARDLPLSAVFEASRLMKRVRRQLPAVKVPTLVLHARHDEVASLRSPRLIVGRLGSGRVELQVFDNSYHMLTLDNDRDAVARACNRFIESLAATADEALLAQRA
jgi:carboxylesterase